MTITLPEEITHSDTEYVRIDIPDSVIEFLKSCESNDRLVEVEAFVSKKSLGRIGQRVSGGFPIKCSFKWDITINGILEPVFDCWIDGEKIGGGLWSYPMPCLTARDKLTLHLRIDP